MPVKIYIFVKLIGEEKNIAVFRRIQSQTFRIFEKNYFSLTKVNFVYLVPITEIQFGEKKLLPSNLQM